jgi:hypothetical protein
MFWGKVAEELTDGLLLKLLARVLVVVVVSRIVGGEDHVVDKLSDALAILVVEDLADNTLKESLVLKLYCLLSFSALPCPGPESLAVCFPALGLGLSPDEAVEVGMGGIEPQGRVFAFHQFAHYHRL